MSQAHPSRPPPHGLSSSRTHGEWRLLRVTELAELLGVSRRKAFSLLGNAIPVVVLGRRCRRVRLADVIEYIESRRS